MERGRPVQAVRAALWEPWRGGPQVYCFLCAHRCRIGPGGLGKCGVRENRDGILYSLVYGCPVSTAVDPVEKKPLFHFLPGTSTYSLATVGCNFSCSFCQNAEISQMPVDRGRITGRPLSAQEVVADALALGCASISYTYTEPTIYYEYARDCARLAVEAGLKNIFVTNGYMTAEMLADIDGSSPRRQRRPQVVLRRVLPQHDRGSAQAGARLHPPAAPDGGVDGGDHPSDPGPQRWGGGTARSCLLPGLGVARPTLARLALLPDVQAARRGPHSRGDGGEGGTHRP